MRTFRSFIAFALLVGTQALSVTAKAADCPNLSGTYNCVMIGKITVVQHDCSSITFNGREIVPNGKSTLSDGNVWSTLEAWRFTREGLVQSIVARRVGVECPGAGGENGECLATRVIRYERNATGDLVMHGENVELHGDGSMLPYENNYACIKAE